MKIRPTFSIADAMTIVLIVAIDFGLVGFDFPNYLILPELSFLLFGLTKLGPGQASRHSWRAFEVVGWIAVGLSLVLYQCYMRTESWEFLLAPANWVQDHVHEAGYGLALGYAFMLIFYAGPQLALATSAGWFSARYRLVRRHPHVPESSDLDRLEAPTGLQSGAARGEEAGTSAGG